MEQKTQRNGVINLVALLLAGATGFGMASYGNSLSGLAGMIFMGIAVLVAAISWFQMRLEEREAIEKLEFQELTKAAGSSALFNAEETEVFPAQRSREQFEQYFVPAFTVLLLIAQGGSGFWLWRYLGQVKTVSFREPTVLMAVFGVLGLILFLLGKYSSSVARIGKLRLLRPGASYILLNAYISFVIALGIMAVVAGFPLADIYIAKAFAILLILIGFETLLNLIFELYRPRLKGKIQRPLYESRLVSLLGQPEGLITTAAQTLDYQFGFKISETWAYRLFEQWLPRLIIFQLVVLLISTCFVFIDAGQEGVLEHFGKPAGVLTPGAHFKYPWPIDRVYRYATEQIQSIDIGFVQDRSASAPSVVLWTVPHDKEENFLVANHTQASVDTNTSSNASVNRPPPVSLLTASIPVQFQITNVLEWAYNNEDPVGLMEHLSYHEVVHYLVSVDLGDIMSHGRSSAADELRKRIQAAANQRNLGVNIVFVGLEDIHPPGKVAPDYEKVVAAIHTKEATILAAQAEAIRATNVADAVSFKAVTDARADRTRREVESAARAALFTNQIPAYDASPSVYAQRAYLQVFARSVTNARSYILLATNTDNIVIFDLEDKVRKDILDSAILPVAPKK